MDSLLYANLDRGFVSGAADGTQFSWPPLIQGDDVRVQLRFTRTVDSGDLVEVRPTVTAARMSLGRVDARPTGGRFSLLIGAWAAPEVSWNVDAPALATVLAARPGGAPTVDAVPGGYRLMFPDVAHDDDPVTIGFASSSLEPDCFVQTSTYRRGSRLAHEIRLVQAPVAFTSGFDRIVPPAPVVTEVQAGGESEGTTWNEVQKLYVDPRFVGTYQLRWDLRRTVPLTAADGAEEIAAALNAIALEGEGWTVGNPDGNTAFIEFTGTDFIGVNHPLLEVFVVDAPPGDVTLVMPLNTREVAALLRSGDVTDLAVEIEVEIEEEDIPFVYTVCRDAVTLRREVIRAGMAARQSINWLRPPGPRDHIPYDPDSVITGDQHYVREVGNGTDDQFDIDHELGSWNLHITVAENEPNGAMMVLGTDYEVVFLGNDSITLTIKPSWNGATAEEPGVPRTDGLIVTLTAAGPKSAFQGHTHPMTAITGLNAAFESLGGRVTALETLVPAGALAARVTGEDVVTRWELPPISSVYPTREAIPVTGSLLSLDVSGIRPGGLMPAVSTSVAVADLPVPLPTAGSTHAGKIYRNVGSAAVRLPGGAGRAGYLLPVNGLASVYWDAVRSRGYWYPVEQFGTEKTFYPLQFEVPLFEFAVLAEQFRAKRRFTIDLGLELAILNATSRAQWVLAVEYGVPGAVTTPTVQGPNLSGITWAVTTPAISQRMILSPIPTIHRLGLTIDRAANGTITALKRLYGDETSAQAPAAAEFVIRGRLTRFDPGNEANPVGLAAARGLNIGSTGEADEALGIAKIV